MLVAKLIDFPKRLMDWNNVRDKIDFDPSYQRRPNLWTNRMNSYFLNTILNRYDFPKIYLADFTYGSTELNEKKKQYAVIDGKQRLSTIFNFFDNLIELDSTPVYLEERAYDLSGFTYSELKYTHPELAKIFDLFEPVIVGVYSDKQEDIYEMFIRLNINVSISGAERRNALPGPMPSFLRKIAINDFFVDKIKFNIDRGQDLNLAAKFMLLEFSNKIENLKKNDLDSLVTKTRNIKEEDVEGNYLKVENVLSKMNNIFLEEDFLLKSPTQIPIYYLFVKRFYDKLNVSNEELRKFFFDFETKRILNRKLLRSRGLGQTDTFLEEIDNEIVSYNSQIRSPDDKANIEGMLLILTERARNINII